MMPATCIRQEYLQIPRIRPSPGIAHALRRERSSVLGYNTPAQRLGGFCTRICRAFYLRAPWEGALRPPTLEYSS
ncbi:MAG: hypothetical protein A3G24_02910 [Betaproteobacteria bacterium RIFCSPLOWO2_12_FULL_62_13]|nr:MAG: hypothetical protein A3G24_02910 [Betaproteobacteria bacterium RIFCSPLOWO2_12_FULL_62_13]